MRSLPLILTAGVWGALVSAAHAADIKPADGNAPVFRIFASSAGGGVNPDSAINLNGKKPLMILTSVAAIGESRDRKAVRLTLSSADARHFADITRKHPNDLLVLEANGRILEAIQATAPVTNGILEFTYPDDATVVDYLRKRFHLK